MGCKGAGVLGLQGLLAPDPMLIVISVRQIPDNGWSCSACASLCFAFLSGSLHLLTPRVCVVGWGGGRVCVTCVCVCVCVCERVPVCMLLCGLCVCVCVRERERATVCVCV